MESECEDFCVSFLEREKAGDFFQDGGGRESNLSDGFGQMDSHSKVEADDDYDYVQKMSDNDES